MTKMPCSCIHGNTWAANRRSCYWYSDEELTEWAPRIEFLNREAGDVSVLFNTDAADQGPQNARRMAKVLAQAGLGDEIENGRAILSMPEQMPVL
jgi:uncharacterized protein YecE (DUF72 family)